MVAKTNKKKSKTTQVETAASTAGSGSLEQYLGKTLLLDTSSPPKPTAEVMKGKKLIGMYFTSSWNPLGKEFTPKLAEFYKKCSVENDMEIVYVSSDDDRKSFLETFSDLPWLAIDGDKDGARVKHNLATHLKVFRLPSLIILNVETGLFVTDHARKQVLELFEKDDNGKETLNVQRGKELIKTWETQEPEEMGHADTFANTLYLTAMHFKKYPIYIVGIIALLLFTNTIRRIQNNPLLGMAMFYLMTRIGKEPLDKNIPYIEQKGDVKGESAKKNE